MHDDEVHFFFFFFFLFFLLKRGLPILVLLFFDWKPPFDERGLRGQAD